MSRKFCLVAFLLCMPFTVFAATFTAGKDYQVVKASNGITSPRGKVSVVEFFSPGCPWCFKLEATLEPWLKHKPSYVVFSRQPLAFESGWNVYQKAYFVAVALNKQKTILPAMFHAIHVKNQDLASKPALTTFFANYDVSAQQFNQLYNSPSIDLQVSQANALMNSYKVYSIPSFIIDGKYKTDAGMAGGNDKKLMQIVSYLIAKAHR